MLSDEEKEAIVYNFSEVTYDAKHHIPYIYKELWKTKKITPHNVDKMLREYEFDSWGTSYYQFSPHLIEKIEQFEQRKNDKISKIDLEESKVESVKITEVNKLEQILKKDIEPFHSMPIEASFIKKLKSNFVFEYQFYFTRAILSNAEYSTLSFGTVFSSTFPTYESYVKEWDSIYWNYSAIYKVNYIFSVILSKFSLLEEVPFYKLLLHGIDIILNKKERLLYGEILKKPYTTINYTAIGQMINWHWYKTLRIDKVMKINDTKQVLNNSLLKKQKKVLQYGLNRYNRLYSEQYAVMIELFYRGEPYNETICSDSAFTMDVYNSLKTNGYIVAKNVCIQGYRINIVVKSRDGKKDIMWVMCETHSFTTDNIAFVTEKYKELDLFNIKIYKLKSFNWSRYRQNEELNLLKAIENVCE